MAVIKLDQDRLAAMTGSLEACNNRIRDMYADVEASIRQLGSVWEGAASENALASFYSIKPRYGNPRWEVFQSYVDYLRNPIAQGYNETEKANTSLADAFL